MSAAGRGARGVIVTGRVPAVVFIGGAHATRVLGVAFPLALVARDACLSRALAPGRCRRHACQGA